MARRVPSGRLWVAVAAGSLLAAAAWTGPVGHTPTPTVFLYFRTQPSDTTAGQPIPLIEVGVDGAAGTVSLAVTPGTGTSGAQLSSAEVATVEGGGARFTDVTMTTAGAGYTLDATLHPDSGDRTPMVVTSAPFDVAPAQATQLAFQTQPTRIVAGEPVTPEVVVQVLDEFGNVTPDVPVDVTLRLAGGSPTPPLTGTVTRSTSAGVAIFDDLRVTGSGTGVRFVATPSNSRLEPTTSAPFDVVSPQALLTFVRQPSDTVAGAVLAPVEVGVVDQFGEPVSSWSAPVELTLRSSTGATLGGSTTRIPHGAPVVFDDLTIERADPAYTLVVASAGAQSTSSVQFAVRPAAASRLLFLTRPGRSESGSDLTGPPRVAVVDRYGNTSDTTTKVGLAVRVPGGGDAGLTCDPAGGRAAERGVVTFDACRVDRPGTGYRLVATAAGLTAAISPPFDVVAPPSAPSPGSGRRNVVAILTGLALVAAAAALIVRLRRPPVAREPVVRVITHDDAGVVRVEPDAAPSHAIRIEPHPDPEPAVLEEQR